VTKITSSGVDNDRIVNVKGWKRGTISPVWRGQRSPVWRRHRKCQGLETIRELLDLQKRIAMILFTYKIG